jgi:hypothetical protein
VAVAFPLGDTLGRWPRKAYSHFAGTGAFQPAAPLVFAFGFLLAGFSFFYFIGLKY